MPVAPAAVEAISREAYGTTFASTALAIVNSHQVLGLQDPRFRYTSVITAGRSKPYAGVVIR